MAKLDGHCCVCRARATIKETRTVYWCDRHGERDTEAGRAAEERRRLREGVAEAYDWLVTDQDFQPTETRAALIAKLAGLIGYQPAAHRSALPGRKEE